ncbi:MAG: AIR carboxylase family protein, partial [Firmicutes bacterium]|nr:AIR carboxylase family protein [Bacillota bacterium]
QGIDALLATVQMPSGIPVATVALDGGVNAALLSAQILALGEPELARKLKEKREAAKAKVLETDRDIAEKLANLLANLK